jgi:hypothetical protein
MEKERAKQKGLSYCQKLLPSARDRYLRKLFDINDVDPYEVPAKQWCADCCCGATRKEWKRTRGGAEWPERGRRNGKDSRR